MREATNIRHKISVIEHVPKLGLPDIGTKFYFDGHEFEFIKIEKYENSGKFLVDCVAVSPMINVTITMSSTLPLFNDGESNG